MSFWTLAAVPYTLGTCVVAYFMRLGIALKVEEIEKHRRFHGPSRRWQRALIEWAVRNGEHGMSLAALICAMTWPWIIIDALLEMLWWRQRRIAGMAPCAADKEIWCSTIGDQFSYITISRCKSVDASPWPYTERYVWLRYVTHAYASRCELNHIPLAWCAEECE